jgi:hypothetical protein
MIAKSVMEPNRPTPPSRVSEHIAMPPVARVILPASAEAATAPQEPAPSTRQEPPAHLVAAQAPQPVVSPDAQPFSDKQAEATPEKRNVAERRKTEAEDRDRRRRAAERKAKRDAARLARQQEQQRQRPEQGILAFGRDDDERPPRAGGFFGN